MRSDIQCSQGRNKLVLASVLAGLFLSIFIILLVIYLVKSSITEENVQESSSSYLDWENQYKQIFISLMPYICTIRTTDSDSNSMCTAYDMMGLKDDEEFYYPKTKEFLKLMQPRLIYSENDTQTYNISYSLDFKIDDHTYNAVEIPLIEKSSKDEYFRPIQTTKKACLATYHGEWDQEKDYCYQYHYLQDICMILDFEKSPYELEYNDDCSVKTQLAYHSLTGLPTLDQLPTDIIIKINSMQNPAMKNISVRRKSGLNKSDKICIFIVGSFLSVFLILFLIKLVYKKKEVDPHQPLPSNPPEFYIDDVKPIENCKFTAD